MTATPIPVLDLSLLDQGPAAADRFRDELRRATHEVGFFTLVGHGIPDELQARLLSTSRAFFALPDEQKLEIENLKSPYFRGYARVGGELTQGKVDWREQIDIGPGREARELGPDDPAYLRLEGPNQWPSALPELRTVIEEWRSRLEVIGRRLLVAWSEAARAAGNLEEARLAAGKAEALDAGDERVRLQVAANALMERRLAEKAGRGKTNGRGVAKKPK